MDIEENLKILGLSKKETAVFDALQKDCLTPLSISKKTNVSRTAVYAILQNFKKRGLIKSNITNGKKHWSFVLEQDIEKRLYNTKRQLLKIPEGREELHGLLDSMIVLHRGRDAIRAVLKKFLFENKNKRLYGFQGNVSEWINIFTVKETNELNQYIKKNGIIVESVLPEGWFEEQTKNFGMEWAKDFEGRTTRVHIIDPKYFNHGGQLWLFKESLYLFALKEEIIVEIRNSEIQKMILMFFRFIQDNSRSIDANALLRKLIGVKEN